MTSYQFNALSDNKKALAVWDGTFIGGRHDDEHNILLYQIDSFYVEVYHDKKLNIIQQFRSFTTTTLLDPYLSQVDLLQLLNK